MLSSFCGPRHLDFRDLEAGTVEEKSLVRVGHPARGKIQNNETAGRII